MTEQNKAPVAFFIFNRPHQTEKVFQSIRKYRPQKLFVVSDGAREGAPGEQEIVDRVRAIATNVDWECDLVTMFANKNLGLRQRFFSALDEIFETEEFAIILEDDCLPDSSFFHFASAALLKYRRVPEVGSVTGNNYLNMSARETRESVFFTRNPEIWGWATWSREWKLFRGSGYQNRVPLLHQIQALFSFEGVTSKVFFANLLLQRKKLATWDIDFSVFERVRKKLVVTPSVNLVTNIGFDNDHATHQTLFSDVDVVESQPLNEFRLPEEFRSVRGFESRAARLRLLRMISLLDRNLRNRK